MRQKLLRQKIKEKFVAFSGHLASGFKFFLCVNANIFDLKKTPFRYVFSVAINVSSEAVGKGVCITRTAAGRNYSTNTIIQC